MRKCSEMFLGTTALGESSEAQVDLEIQAPTTFGYHNEIGQFKIKVTTSAAGHPELPADNTTVLTFTVRARGFSTPGFEVAFTIVALMAAIIIYKKKHRKKD